MTVVGFPTVPLLLRLGLGDRLVTAPEATPDAAIPLAAHCWSGTGSAPSRATRFSYTLKVFTDRHGLEAFRAIVLENQPRIRCCAVLPSRPDDELGYEYLPEEEVPEARFAEIVAGIRDPALHEMIDLAHLQCAGGRCPI